KPPPHEGTQYLKHRQKLTNPLIAGDSLLVMNSLIEKETLAGQVQMFYFDPPYGIKYGSNFQPFVNKREVKDGKDEDLTQEPEMIRAFGDTWELGVHSYLTYLRARLLFFRGLLSPSGSVFVQISDENVHHVREILDEVLGTENFCSLIVYKKTGGLRASLLASECDYILWYARSKAEVKYHQIHIEKSFEEGTAKTYSWVQLPDGSRRGTTKEERANPSLLPKGARISKAANL